MANLKEAELVILHEQLLADMTEPIGIAELCKKVLANKKLHKHTKAQSYAWLRAVVRCALQRLVLDGKAKRKDKDGAKLWVKVNGTSPAEVLDSSNAGPANAAVQSITRGIATFNSTTATAATPVSFKLKLPTDAEAEKEHWEQLEKQTLRLAGAVLKRSTSEVRQHLVSILEQISQ